MVRDLLRREGWSVVHQLGEAGDVSYSVFTKRSTFCSTVSSDDPLSTLLSGAVGSDEASAGKKGSLSLCERGIQAFAPVAW